MTYTIETIEPIPKLVGTASSWSVINQSAPLGNGFSSKTWLGANVTILYPVWIPVRTPARRVWWVNGATVSGTAGVGLYSSDSQGAPSVLRWSQTAAQATINVVQFTSIATPDVVPPGLWWLALASTSATATFFGTGFTQEGRFGTSKLELATNMPSSASGYAHSTGNQVGWAYGFATTDTP